jgi:hypothetical protein
MNSLEGVAQRFIGDSEFARIMGRGVPLNTDDNMSLEYRFARHVGRLSSYTLDDLRRPAQTCNAGALPWSGVRRRLRRTIGSDSADRRLCGAEHRATGAAPPAARTPNA